MLGEGTQHQAEGESETKAAHLLLPFLLCISNLLFCQIETFFPNHSTKIAFLKKKSNNKNCISIFSPPDFLANPHNKEIVMKKSNIHTYIYGIKDLKQYVTLFILHFNICDMNRP